MTVIPVDFRRKTPNEENDYRSPPARKWPKIEKGQDFFTLTEKHGRPNGPFDRERQLPYGK
jgi:hypothetical protein